ncbi:MAG: F0F1 ATP synthase subunit B' [Rhodospirillales bacterium]
MPHGLLDALRKTVLAAALLALATPAMAEGLPQLDPKSFAPQLIWLAITFIALYIAMSRVVLPRIGNTIMRREEKIVSDLDRAQALRNEATNVLAAYEQAMADARGEAQGIVRAASEAMAAESAKRGAEMGAKVAQQIKGAETRIAAARSQALDQLRQVAGDVALAAVAKLTDTKPDADRVKSAVDRVLAETGK